MSTRVRSYCKINLGLAVGPSRPDGFHALSTVYQTLQLHDFVTVTASREGRDEHPDHLQSPRRPSHRGRQCRAQYRLEDGPQDPRTPANHRRRRHPHRKNSPHPGRHGCRISQCCRCNSRIRKGVRRRTERPRPSRSGRGGRLRRAALSAWRNGSRRRSRRRSLPAARSPPLHCVVALPEVGVSTALAFQQLDAAQLTSGAAVDKLKQLSRALASVWSTSGVESWPLRYCSYEPNWIDSKRLAFG